MIQFPAQPHSRKKLNKQSHNAIPHNIDPVSISISKRPMKEMFFFLKLHIAVVNCSALTPPANGTVSPRSCLSRSTYGQTCSISCNTPGYVLEGTSARVCDKNGEWTGNKDTFCRGIEYFLLQVLHYKNLPIFILPLFISIVGEVKN